jgi:glycosyltransferase involved in cell wall biosynthesis
MTTPKAGLLVTAYYFDPAGAVGALRPWRFHRYLRSVGYESRVIAAFTQPSASPEIYRVEDSAAAFWERRRADRMAGRPLERMPLDCHIERLLRKTLFPLQAGLAWSRLAAERGSALLMRNPSLSVVMSTSPPLSAHRVAYQLVRKHRLAWIADFRDPVNYGSSSPSALVRFAIGQVERRIFKHARAIIANTEAMAAGWRLKYPWAAEKIHVIWNGFDPEHDLTPLPIPVRNRRSFVHAGSLYAGRNANVLVAGLARRRAKGLDRDDIRIVLAGSMDETAGIDEAGYEAAIAQGWLEMTRRAVSRPEAESLMRQADGLLLLQPQSAIQVPAKLFEYLSIGRPILAIVPRDSSVEWILKNAGVPFVAIYPDEPAESFERKLVQYFALPNTATPANEWFRRTFDSSRQSIQLGNIIDAIAPS